MQTKKEHKIECKFCHNLFIRVGIDMCKSCHDEYINRRDLIDELGIKRNKRYAQKLYDEHLKTMGSDPDKEWFEKKRLLKSNLLKYESNKYFIN